jgi:hypothetical protein
MHQAYLSEKTCYVLTPLVLQLTRSLGHVFPTQGLSADDNCRVEPVLNVTRGGLVGPAKRLRG